MLACCSLLCRVCILALVVVSATRVRAEPPQVLRLSEQELPKHIKPAFALVTALAYRDAAGENLAVFSRRFAPEQGEARLQVDLWSGKTREQAKLVRSIKDAVARCEFDLYADFLEQALSVSDLDGDGIGELTFAYRQMCTSDVSPFALKLLLLEGRSKYIIRGETLVDVGNGERVGGSKQVEPALTKQPRFLRHAEQVWSTVVSLSPW